MPVSKLALTNASCRTLREGRPAASVAASSAVVPSVNVPVLSVQSTDISPRFSMALRCRTITPRFAIRRAPAERVTLMIAGRSSGERPTARATANSSESTAGRSSRRLTVTTNRTIAIITLISRYPKRRTPRANSVSGGLALRRSAMAPNSVAAPVRTANTRAVPLRTEAPRNTLLLRPETGASADTMPGRFSTGNDSPVMLASVTRKSCASSTRPSAGTRLPADSRNTSPGTMVSTGTMVVSPSRTTRAVSARRRFRASTAADARYSCEKLSSELPRTIARMIEALTGSWSTSETMAAKIRIRTSGLSNCRSRRRGVERRESLRTRFGPAVASTAAARAVDRPARSDPRSAATAAASLLQ